MLKQSANDVAPECKVIKRATKLKMNCKYKLLVYD